MIKMKPANIMTRSTKSTLLSVVVIFVLTFASCETSRYGSNSWMDLQHSRDLDAMKGKRLKPIQKNVSKAEHF